LPIDIPRDRQGSFEPQLIPNSRPSIPSHIKS